MAGYGYKHADETSEKASGGGNFVSLKSDHDKFIGAIIGEVYYEETFWNAKTDRKERFTKEAEAGGNRMSVTFFWNVYIIAEGNGENLRRLDPPAVKVFSCSNATYKRIRNQQKKFPQERYFIEVERIGAKNDPKTTYEILPDQEIPTEVQSRLAKADSAHMSWLKQGTLIPEGVLALHDLRKAFGDQDEPANGTSTCIDAETADNLKTRLKNIPRAMLDAFLVEFGVNVIKDIRASDAARAEKRSLELEAAHQKELAAQSAQTRPRSNDPFA